MNIKNILTIILLAAFTILSGCAAWDSMNLGFGWKKAYPPIPPATNSVVEPGK